MQKLPSKPGRPKKVVFDDTPATKGEDVRVEDVAPFAVLSIASDKNGNVLGLGNDGKIYRYNTIQQEWNIYQ